MKITRRFTRPGEDVFATVDYARRTSRITNPDGSVVFEMKDAEVPKAWSQLATDIMVSKYFRKAGVPQTGPDGQPLLDESGNPVLGPERSARQVISRLAGTWRHWDTLTLATTASTLVSVYRVRAGKHFPTDVLAGTFAGAGIGIVVPHLHRTEDVQQRRVWVGFAPEMQEQRMQGGSLTLSGKF